MVANGICDASNSSMPLATMPVDGAPQVRVAAPVRTDVQLVAHRHVVDRVVVPVGRRAGSRCARRSPHRRGPGSGEQMARPVQNRSMRGSMPCAQARPGTAPCRCPSRRSGRRSAATAARGRRTRARRRATCASTRSLKAARSSGCWSSRGMSSSSSPKSSTPSAATLRSLATRRRQVRLVGVADVEPRRDAPGQAACRCPAALDQLAQARRAPRRRRRRASRGARAGRPWGRTRTCSCPAPPGTR